MMYTILYAETVELLIAKVGQACADGWEPIGGVAVSDAVFLQAMTLVVA